MFNARQFATAITRTTKSTADWDGIISYAITKDAETGNPDNLNRAKAAIDAQPGYKVRKALIDFITGHCAFSIKENGKFGKKKGKKPSDYETPPLFSEFTAAADKAAAEKRAAAKAKREQAKKDAEKRPAADRLADAAKAAAEKLAADFADLSPDVIREAVTLAVIAACPMEAPQVITGKGKNADRKAKAKANSGNAPDRQSGAAKVA